MNRTTRRAHRKNYGQHRPFKAIKFIALHGTHTDGDTAAKEGNYFATQTPGTSAHDFVDAEGVVHSVPYDYTAYSVGGRKWGDCGLTGGGKYYGIACNQNTLNIEMCDDGIRDGKFFINEATKRNAAKLTAELMKRFEIPLNHVIRHFDVNGKHCPATMLAECDWAAMKRMIAEAADTSVKEDIIIINGAERKIPMIRDGGNTFLETRAAADACGIAVSNRGKTPVLTGDGEGKEMPEIQGKELLIYNEKKKYVSMRRRNGKTYIKTRDFADACGLEVGNKGRVPILGKKNKAL